MSDTTFNLHPRLAADTFQVGVLPLCQVLLMNDCRYPWCVLVPRREAVREIHELDDNDQQVLIHEVSTVSAIMQRMHAADKMNIGALGNVVPQLHVHVIARFEHDAAWPSPIWGNGLPQPYSPSERDQHLQTLQAAMDSLQEFRREP